MMLSETVSGSFTEIKSGTFIFEIKGALTLEQSHSMIDRFELDTEQHMPGRIGQMGDVDDRVKKTTDLPISGNPQWQDIDKQLFISLASVLREYREHFPFFQGSFKDTGYHMQRYLPHEYYHWHIDGGSHDFSDRQLVALWYLNDVEGPGGETEFLHQGVKVKPEQGKLILFPPFWTHEHRAVELEKGVKYVATTWLSFT